MKRLNTPAQYEVQGKASVRALVSVFDVLDVQNDRVQKGAFVDSIARWKQSGDPIPVVLSHRWDDAWSHIGVVDEIRETSKGLEATYTLDVTDNPLAAQTHKLMKRRSLKEHSFAYSIVEEKRASDGSNLLTALDIIEVGPTLKGANPATELLEVKSALEMLNSGRRPAVDFDYDLKANASLFKSLSRQCLALSKRLGQRDPDPELAYYQGLIDRAKSGSSDPAPVFLSPAAELAHYQRLIDEARAR